MEDILKRIGFVFVGFLLSFLIIFELTNRDPIGWLTADMEKNNVVVPVCKKLGIYNSKIPYTEVCYYVRKYSELYELDRKLVYAVIIKESEFVPSAKNVNWNGSLDRGLMQINTVWNDVIMSDNMLETMFKKDAHKINAVEEFIYNIQHNVFIGCFILKEKLSINKGVLTGISRYNGAGYSAEQYAIRVNELFHLISARY